MTQAKINRYIQNHIMLRRETHDRINYGGVREKQMSNEFKQLLDSCGMSIKSAAPLLGIKYHTVRNYAYDKTPTPDEVLRKLRRYKTQAIKIFGHEKVS